MDIILIVLRLLHIVSAFVWVGLGAALTFYVAPAAVAAGDSGFRFLKSLFLNTAFARVIPIVSGVTTLAGILLYLVGNSALHFSQTGNMVLGIGAVAGFIATVHGGAMTGRATRILGAALAKDGTPLGELNDLAAKLLSHARVSMALMIIALVGMSSARYL
jgi:uncharacterized membrane protein